MNPTFGTDMSSLPPAGANSPGGGPSENCLLNGMPIAQAAYQHNGQTVSAKAFYAVACDPRRHVAIEACAGAGKTWMLVSRIVRALLDGAAPQEILAITFTKRAAGEMSERLYQWLGEFSAADADTLARELSIRGVFGNSGLAPTQNQRELLSNLYQTVLATGRQVQIRTFHGWFAALLRGAPLGVLQQLGLPANYELLEDDSKAKALVWRRFYAGLVASPSHRSDFEALVFAHGRFQTDKALQAALDKRVEFSLADAHGVVDVSVAPFGALFPEFAGLPSPVAALGGEPARARWLARAKALGGEANKTPQKTARAVVDAFALDDLNQRLDILRGAFFVADEDRLTKNLQKFAAAQEAEPELQRLCAARHQHTAWDYQQRMARLTRVLIADFAEVKREQGWVDMNDVERAALVLLGDPVLSGWVQQRLDARIRHVLIDEFQDTNPLQWQALLSWLGSYAGSGGGSAPSVFIVGDPKQSIYRFRRAEPQVFKAALAFVHDVLGGDLLSCDHTRRNASRIINTVNTTMQAAVESDGYTGFRAHTTSSELSGQVFRLPPIARDMAGSGGDIGSQGSGSLPEWRDSLTVPREVPEETLRTLEARQAARWIASQLSQGITPRDVMVLSRKRTGLGPLQDELRALGIAARIGEKTELIDCCEVQDIVALLDVLVSPQHDLSLARVLKSPLFNLPDEALVQLATLKADGSLSWFDLLRNQELSSPILHGLSAILMRWKGWVDQLPPHDALQAIYSDGDVLARFARTAPAVQRDAVLANLRALLGVSLQLGGGRFATPYTFVRALKAGGVQAPAAVLDDAVRLLTIHGAKGLEGHTVLLLDTDTSPRNSDTMSVLVDWPGEAALPRKFVFMASESRPPACAADTLQMEVIERQREELNALYVAITRAKHTLAISSIEPAKSPEHSWWGRLSPLADDVEWPAAEPGNVLNDVAAARGTPKEFHIKDMPLVHIDIALNATKNEAKPVANEDSETSRIGQAMHRLLQWADAGDANVAAAGREFRLTTVQRETAAEMARRIRAGEGDWAWDRAVVRWQRDEVELLHGGNTLRLDRLVQRSDTGEWWVLDHKSHHAPQDAPALVAQLRDYRDAVSAIYPGQVVRAAFLTGQGQLVEPF